MQQHMQMKQEPKSPIRRSSIFRTATIRNATGAALYNTNGMDSKVADLSFRAPCASASNGLLNPSDYIFRDFPLHGADYNGNLNFGEHLNGLNASASLDLDLDHGIFANFDSEKLFENDLFKNGTNDTTETYVEAFRLNSGASDEDDTMSIEDSLYAPHPQQSQTATQSKKSTTSEQTSTSSECSNNSRSQTYQAPLTKSSSTKPLAVRSEPRQGRRASTLVLADLERYYTQPLAEASRALGLSATMLKKVCRSFGIRRWPHRQLASIDRTIARVRQRLAVQERTHFYTLEGDCRASAALRGKVAQLEGKKDTICRLTSRGMSLHNVTKNKHPDKAIMDELNKPLDASKLSGASTPNLKSPPTSAQAKPLTSSTLSVQDRLSSSQPLTSGWDFSNAMNSSASNMMQDAMSISIPGFNVSPNHQQVKMEEHLQKQRFVQQYSNQEAQLEQECQALMQCMHFSDMDMGIDTTNAWLNMNSGDNGSSSDALLRSSSPWSGHDDAFDLFLPMDTNMNNGLGMSDFSQAQNCLF